MTKEDSKNYVFKKKKKNVFTLDGGSQSVAVF